MASGRGMETAVACQTRSCEKSILIVLCAMSFIDTYNMVYASHVLDSAGKGGNRALITFVVVSSSGFACDLALQMFLSLRAQNKSARFRCSRKIPSRTARLFLHFNRLCKPQESTHQISVSQTYSSYPIKQMKINRTFGLEQGEEPTMTDVGYM